MKNIDNYLYQYSLHDCTVEKIYVQDSMLIFSFGTGVYNLDKKGIEITKTESCSMNLEIENLDKRQMWEHIEISKLSKNKLSEIEFEKFIEEVEKFKFEIIDNYLSYFGQSILLEGYSSQNRYQIKVSEIKKIEFIFNK